MAIQKKSDTSEYIFVESEHNVVNEHRVKSFVL